MGAYAGLLVALAAVSCASTPPYPEKSILKIELKTFERPQNHPELSVVSAVQVGESMVASTMELVLPRLIVKERLRVVAPYRQSQTMAFDIEPGEKELIGVDGAGGYFYSGGPLPHFYDSRGTFEYHSAVVGGVYVDASGATYVYWQWEGYPRPYVFAAPGLKYERVEKATGDIRRASFRRELVYTGVSQSTLSLLYREFKNDMARPAFSQELRYDLSQGNVIGYQGARFEVLSANNTGITYRVQTHMPMPTN